MYIGQTSLIRMPDSLVKNILQLSAQKCVAFQVLLEHQLKVCIENVLSMSMGIIRLLFLILKNFNIIKTHYLDFLKNWKIYDTY